MLRLPEDFQSAMEKKLGSEFPDFLASLEQQPPVSIRINPEKPASVKTDSDVLWTKSGKYLNTRPGFTFDPLFHSGCYYVQEASSMFLEQAFRQTIDSDKAITVLDLSAAPGGKSTHILSLLNSNSLLVSNEVIRSRASILNENILKWGHANVIVTNNDPEHFQSLPGFFDAIVVDAPCSGEGLFRKDPQAVDQWSSENVALCAARQKRILADIWPSLKENGILIYCTCTHNEQENEENLTWLLSEHEPEFIALKTEESWGIEEVSNGEIIGYRFYPHRVRGEGFFLSVMRKKENTASSRTKLKQKLVPAPKKYIQTLSGWIQNSEAFEFYQHNEFVFVLPKECIQKAETISQHLKIVNPGTTLASVKHDKFIPEHAAALSIHLNRLHFPQVSFNYDDAIKFLRKDVLGPVDGTKGFCLVTYENAPLGWLNNLGTRVNNLYPNEWRIRNTQPDKKGN